MSKKPLPKLIIASSQHDADSLYATGFFVPDAFIFLQHRGRSTAVLSDLEVDRGRKEAQVDEVVALSDVAKKCPNGKNASFVEQVSTFLRSRKVRRAAVPGSFPSRWVSQPILRRPESSSSRSRDSFGKSVSSRAQRRSSSCSRPWPSRRREWAAESKC